MQTTVTGRRSDTIDEAPAPSRAGTDLGSPAAPSNQPDPRPTAEHRPWHRISRSGWITAAIATVTAALYTWSLSTIGYGNSYYAAAVKSATVSWKAFFFGSLDPGSFITVDKPPVALWVQALSARIFGFNSWSLLLPEAAAGVASVLILHHIVRKWAGDVAAHLAAAAFAITPVAVLMFRYNNPDAILTLLCLGAAWALWSAIETGRTRALIASALLIGLAFDTKMLQAFLVLPAFIGVYLLAGKPRLRVRIAQLAAAAGTLIVAAGWWIAVVALWPASSRPYIGSTTDNSIISLLTGYNGLSRLFGNTGAGGTAAGGAPGGAGGAGTTGFGGASGPGRMFNTALGGQIAWLIPMAVAGLVAGLWLTRRRPRTDRSRAGWLLWGGWALVCVAVFSLSKGVFHPYYTVQLAPAIAALAGAGGVALWRLGRTHRAMVWALPAAIVVTAGLSVVLLARTAGYDSWLPPLIIAGGALGAAGLWAGSVLRQRTLVLVAAVVAGITLLAGPMAYAITTVRAGASGSLVSAGPGSTGLGGGFGGGLGGDSTSSVSGLVSYLEAHQGTAKYLVATTGSQSSASIIIASGRPVITIGGFNGGDPAPTLAQFEQLVATGQVRYVLVTGTGGGGIGGGGPGGGQGTSQAIDAWVTAHGQAVPSTSLGGSTTAGTLYEVSAS
jgi:4-amino-4-deoxy-L-arabinose transferase-like glycosyltransferase